MICFIHPKAKSNKETSMGAIYMSHDVKEEFTKYTIDNMELTIVHICLFKSILEKCNFCKEQKLHSCFWKIYKKSTTSLTCMLAPMASSSSRSLKRPGRR